MISSSWDNENKWLQLLLRERYCSVMQSQLHMRCHTHELSSNDGKECLEKKRAKISKEIRLSRITELQEQIKDKNEQVQYKDLRREAAKNVHNYKECDKLTEQMSVLKSDRRGLS